MNLRAWAELLRLPALFTVPGDALAGAAATGLRPGRGTFLAIGSSLCLYEAGMALNDWADRDEDAIDRPHRPIPSGRVTPTAAFTAAVALTAGGLALASRAGRPALATATALAGTVWAYDLGLKRTPAGPLAMAAARGLDLLLGATATATGASAGARADAAARTATATDAGPAGSAAKTSPKTPRSAEATATCPSLAAAARAALPSAATLAAHTLAVTTVSRHETQGGSTGAPLGALATTLALGHAVAYTSHPPADRRTAAAAGLPGTTSGRPGTTSGLPGTAALRSSTTVALGTAYATTAARPYLHAALNPSPPLTQRAVGGGIRALIPLQAALAARSGALGSALFTAALAPMARRFARKVSVT